MIQSLTIKNYQSHHDTTVELAPLTVIVGPSSVGKSAFTRALKALASNQAGKDFITHGESTAQISATTDRGTGVLTNGKPEDSYVISPAGDEKNPRRYTKLGGTVPEAVTDMLGIAAKDAVNFAGQFDMPYLLRTSASEVARTLGELTNVSAVFEAARESLRRKNNFSTTLKTRESDLESLTPRLESYTAVPAQLEAIEEAEKSISIAQARRASLDRLQNLMLTVQTATARLKAAQGATSAPLPDTTAAVATLGRLQRLDALTGALRAAGTSLKAAQESVQAQSSTIASLSEEYDALLREHGTCPTCGQDTKEIHHAHA